MRVDHEAVFVVSHARFAVHNVGRVAAYKIPRRVLFFDEDELSLTGNSKIRGDELRKLAMQRLSVVESGGER